MLFGIVWVRSASATVACVFRDRGWGTCERASRLKNNLSLSAEIGFVSLSCFMQAIKLLRGSGHERTWRPQQIA
jgi:hypothetical protein